MNEKRDCKIVQDLLPHYIEELTNEETNKFLDEHLNECRECKNTYENMKKEIELNVLKKDNREVKYIKKFKRQFTMLRNIVLIILVFLLIYLGNTYRKFLIIKNLQKKVDENYKITDYHITDFNNNGYIEYFRKGDKLAQFCYSNGENGRTESLYYYKDGKVNIYIEETEGKKAILNLEADSIRSMLDYNVIDSFARVINGETNNLALFRLCSKLRIEEGDGGTGVKCYIIDNSRYVIDYDLKYQIFIDKDTGLRMKDSEGHSYKYDFNPVSEVIFEEPDISEYEIVTPTWLR